MPIRRSLSLLVALLALGCADGISPQLLDGTWTHDSGIPGNMLRFTLVTNGDVVSGDGSWSGEACCAGSVTVAGHVSGDVIDLDLTLTRTSGGSAPPIAEHFQGNLLLWGTLAGVLVVNGQSVSYTFNKVQ